MYKIAQQNEHSNPNNNLKINRREKIPTKRFHFSRIPDSRNGSSELVDMPAGTVPNLGAVAGVGGEDMASLWASYAMGLKKTPPPASAATPSRSDRDRESSPPGEGTGSAHDETSSSGNKEDEDDDDEDADERLDPRHHDPERQKAFNVSPRIYVIPFSFAPSFFLFSSLCSVSAAAWLMKRVENEFERASWRGWVFLIVENRDCDNDFNRSDIISRLIVAQLSLNIFL